ncbi:MAG: hypothetical protein GX882_04475 [Methanomicrobiales archaeon]|nr:hypothetical protein [Methanomicrobiales archaeon]
MDISRLKHRVEVLSSDGEIKRYGPFNEQKAREFFEVEESLGGTARIMRLEGGIQQRWEVLAGCGDWGDPGGRPREDKRAGLPAR